MFTMSAQVIKKDSKKGRYWTARYERATATGVTGAYARPSQAKINADAILRDAAYAHGGRGYRIISAGSAVFTAAWLTDEGLRVETRDYSYIIK